MDLVRSLRRIIRHFTRKARFYGFYEYRVVESIMRSVVEGGERLTLQAVTKLEGLPDTPTVDKLHGVAGAFEQCAPGSLVLVGFRGGEPGRPYVGHYLPSTPLRTLLDASLELTLGSSLTPPLSLHLGGTGPDQRPIALAPALSAYLAAAEACLLVLDATVSAAPGGASLVAARKAAFTAGTTTGTGWTSSRTTSG
jgi:hypothetical protein